jgi:hypothetical protein
MKGALPRLAPFRSLNPYVQRRSLSNHLDVLAKHVDSLVPPSWDDNAPAKIRPSENVRYVCRKYDMGFPWNMKPLKGVKLANNPYKLRTFVSHQHCLSAQSQKYFDSVEHPWAKSLLDIYVEKTKTPLWLNIESFGSGARPVPCHKSNKIVREAIEEALTASGYDRYGHKQVVDGEFSPVADLYGTLRVAVGDPIAVCNASNADILKAAETVVHHAAMALRRDKNGQHIMQQQRHNASQKHRSLPPTGSRSHQSQGTQQRNKETRHSSQDETLRQSTVKSPKQKRSFHRAPDRILSKHTPKAPTR